MRLLLLLSFVLAACPEPARQDFNARRTDAGSSVPGDGGGNASNDGGPSADAGVNSGEVMVVAVGDDHPGRLEAGVMHRYRFVALDAPTHRMETLGDTDTWCELRTGDGDAIEDNDDGGDGLNCGIEHALEPDRAYELMVRHFLDTGEGDYTLRITPLGGVVLDPQIRLDGERVPAGQGMGVSGEGFTPSGLIRIEIAGGDDLPQTEIQADDQGRFSHRIRTTRDTTPGTYRVRATDQETGIWSGWRDWFIDPPAADDHGNDRASATPLTVGVVFDGHIEESGDTDWFRFDVARAGEYTVETRGTTDTKCAFMDPQDAFIGDEDDDGGEETNCRTTQSLEAGTAWVRIRAFMNTTGPYEVIVQAPVTADDHGGDRVHATLVVANTVVGGHLGEAGDEDWFAFNAEVGGVYTLRTIGSLDAHCTLMDQEGNVVTEDDNSGLGANCQIQRVLPGHRVWYLRVRHAAGTGTGDYRLFLNGGGRTPEDDHGNDSDHATLVAPTGTVSGRFEEPSDQDFIRFATQEAGTWTLLTEGDSDTICVLYDEAGEQLRQNDDGGQGLNCRIEHQLEPEQIYTFSVRPYQASATGAYRIQLSR